METLAALHPTIALELLVRGTALLLGAALLSWGLRKGAAQTRHLLWTVTFLALLGLPVAALVGVGWDLPVLPAESGLEAGLAPGLAPDQPTDWETTRGPLGVFDARTAVRVAESVASGSTGAVGRGVPWTAFPWIIWMAGIGATLLSLLIGALRLRAIVRRARPLRDPGWQGQSALLRRKLGIRRDVRLLTSSETATPMTSGWQRPVVLLPESAADWSAERRDVVLAHELTHVRRHDAVRHILGRVALALYWFHPLGWLASRLARSSREQACDESVVALGALPSQYASHLLDLAAGLSPAPAVLALPIVQRSQLEKRIMAILRPHPVRATPVASALVLLVVSALGVSAATARPVAVSSQAVAAPSPVPEIAPEAASPRPPRVLEPAGVPAGPDPWPEPTGVLAGPEAWPEPAPVTAQDASCRMEGMSGNFSGTLSTRGDRTEQSGWHNGDRTIQRYVDDLRLCMRIHGEVVMENDGLAVRAVGADSWVVLESEEHELRRLVITEGPGGIEHDWTIDGRTAAFGADGEAWRDQMFKVLGGYWEASRIRGQQSSLRGQISSHRGHISSLRGQTSSLHGHVSSLKGQMSSLRGHLSTLKGQISSHRGHISSLRGQISSHNGQASGLRSALRSTSDDETRARLEREIRGNAGEIRDLEQQIEDYAVDVRVREVEREIEDFAVDVRVREVEREIEEFAVDVKVREVEQQIENYDLDAKVREVEREIEELDADRRAEAIERDMESEVATLRRLIRG